MPTQRCCALPPYSWFGLFQATGSNHHGTGSDTLQSRASFPCRYILSQLNTQALGINTHWYTSPSLHSLQERHSPALCLIGLMTPVVFARARSLGIKTFVLICVLGASLSAKSNLLSHPPFYLYREKHHLAQPLCPTLDLPLQTWIIQWAHQSQDPWAINVNVCQFLFRAGCGPQLMLNIYWAAHNGWCPFWPARGTTLRRDRKCLPKGINIPHYEAQKGILKLQGVLLPYFIKLKVPINLMILYWCTIIFWT